MYYIHKLTSYVPESRLFEE